MALIGSFVDDSGNSHASAYAIVIEVNCNWFAETAHCVVAIFRNESARRNNRRPVAQFNYDFSSLDQRDTLGNLIRPKFADVFATAKLNARNPIKATYEYVKPLAEWAGWVDDLKVEGG